MRRILVSGGAGFIGSHVCAALLEWGHEVVVVDDFSNSDPSALDRVAAVAGRRPTAYRMDVRDRRCLAAVFGAHAIDVVIHLAAKKAVSESVRMPLTYYDVNVAGTLALLETACRHAVRDFVFSSSCSIYGWAKRSPIDEDEPPAPVSPYGASKRMCEEVLAAGCEQYRDLSVISLRYFNPIGAHESGLLGDDPTGVPNNVMPILARVATGRLDQLDVFGGDYPTVDGTAVRDYVHVADVADGHRVALDHLADGVGLRAFNLGTGVGTSVLQLVQAFGRACGQELPYRIVARRPGDVAELVGDPGRVRRAWNWRATRDLDAMCRDAWRFQQRTVSAGRTQRTSLPAERIAPVPGLQESSKLVHEIID